MKERYVFQANDTICTVNTLYCCGTTVKLNVCTAGQIYIKNHAKRLVNGQSLTEIQIV